jgi:hypothetical protein
VTTAAEKRWRTWRRRDLNQGLVDELAKHFRAGATVKIAAGLVGVPPGVLRMWLREGEKQLAEIYDSDVGYPEHEGLLYAECAKATAEYLADRVSTITEPGDAEWRASSWLLERRDEDFNPAAKVDIQTHSTVEVVQHDRELIAAELHAIFGGRPIPGLAQGSAGELLPARPDDEAAVGAHPAEPARSDQAV